MDLNDPESMLAWPLLLLPGLMCDQAVWTPLQAPLASRRDCTVVDYGLDDALPQMARRVLAQAPERFVLAGHSMGGRVALEVHRLAPERVLGLALLDTGHLPRPAGQAGDDEAAKRMALLQVAQSQGVRAMAMQWVRGMVHPSRLGDAELIERILAMFSRKSAEVFECQIRALLSRPDGSDVLRSLAVPTLLMCGAQDSWSPPAQHQAMLDLVSPAQAQLVLNDDAGHMAPMERPAAVAQALLHWLDRCDVQATAFARP